MPHPTKLRDDLVSALSDQLEPPVRLSAQLVDIDGAVLVLAETATISVVVLSEVDSGGMDASRFEDNPVIRWVIPNLVAETVSVLRRHMCVRSYVNGAGRRERFDYLMEAYGKRSSMRSCAAITAMSSAARGSRWSSTRTAGGPQSSPAGLGAHCTADQLSRLTGPDWWLASVVRVTGRSRA